MKNKLLIIISGLIILILITIGLSYAYFTANLSGGEDSTTITVTGGTMNIIYNSGANINIANIIPSDNPATTKTFTVTGNNSTDIEMKYQISLIVETNTFSAEALKYKLISTNTNSNGTVAPTITILTNIGSGTKNIDLGIGQFEAPTGGNKVHTYNLEIYFPNIGANQNIDQEKELKAYVKIENYKSTLFDKILAQNGGQSAIEAKGIPDFNVLNGVSGLYAADDEYGTSYYYRGEKNQLSNNLIWGGFQWKIIRINGDSSIRLIYNGTEEEFNVSSTVNNTGANTQIGAGVWNTTNYKDAKYLGYMYGGANGVESTMRNGATSVAATYNETSTNVKNQLDNWYASNIKDKTYESQIADNLFCNDRQLQSEVGGPESGLGYGDTRIDTYYAAYHRLITTKTPTLKCGLKNDRFTVSDILIGNGSLIYPVGLITADETAMAGLRFPGTNTTNYLYTNTTFWTLTPRDSSYPDEMGSYSHIIVITGMITFNRVTFSTGIRPTISIKSNVQVTGDGSATNPYKVI